MFWDKKLRRWAEAVRARADLPARLVLWNGEQFDFGRFAQPRVTLPCAAPRPCRCCWTPAWTTWARPM